MHPSPDPYGPSMCQDDHEAAEKKQGQFNTMEKRGSDLQKEVKILQEALADFNTVLDKVRGGKGKEGMMSCVG